MRKIKAVSITTENFAPYGYIGNITAPGDAYGLGTAPCVFHRDMNHQSLIATKANRIVRAAAGRPVAEFGARRAQSYDAAILGARAAYIGGVTSTSCVLAARDFGIPVSGTMAHSWVQMFPSEYEAFKKYAELYPEGCVLLVDTYSVTKSGIPNAIKVFNEVLAPRGIRPLGVRIDSGDIAYLSKRSRRMRWYTCAGGAAGLPVNSWQTTSAPTPRGCAR